MGCLSFAEIHLHMISIIKTRQRLGWWQHSGSSICNLHVFKNSLELRFISVTSIFDWKTHLRQSQMQFLNKIKKSSSDNWTHHLACHPNLPM